MLRSFAVWCTSADDVTVCSGVSSNDTVQISYHKLKILPRCKQWITELPDGGIRDSNVRSSRWQVVFGSVAHKCKQGYTVTALHQKRLSPP